MIIQRASSTFRFYLLLSVTILIGSLLTLLLPLPAQPQAIAARTRFTTPSGGSSGHITIIVLDMSGSMATNDPQGLRCSAADAYIDMSGVNNAIGIVGLDNNNGSRTGNNNFLTAQSWTSPLNTDTVGERQTLRNIIKVRSNSCRPDQTTPTYDALAQAYQMLADATKNKSVSGSVILLTDGTPDPDTVPQIQKIQSELLPQFKTQHWPIDTIALGADGPINGMDMTFHDFLNGIANSTSGKFYDDTNGPVKGDQNGSPLNIAPFFVDIFTRRIGRTPGADIAPTLLDGNTTSRNFTVTDYTNNLDVVVVKDQSTTTASLITPSGQTITPSSQGVLVAQDNYYVIFSIDQPLPGSWELDVSGSGQFLMKSLKISSVGASINTISLKNSNIPASNTLPLGQPLVVSASLTSSGQPITDNTFSVNGTIRYAGGNGEYSGSFILNDKDVPGNYVGDITVPTSAPSGSYDIQVSASTVSLTNLVASDTKSLRLDIFPVPLFTLPQTNQPTDQTISKTVVVWPTPLRWLYSLPVFSQLSHWPLQGNTAEPNASLPGIVQWQGKPYTSAGTQLKAQAFAGDAKNAIPVTIIQGNPGTFNAQFMTDTSATYNVVFSTSGSYKDSHGDFGPTVRSVNVTATPPSASELIYAYIITLVYLLIFVFLIFLVKFWITPRPFGEWRRTMGGEFVGNLSFSRAHRDPIQWFFKRNQLTSRQAKMPKGLLFKFGYGGGILVQPDGSKSSDWHMADGTALRPGLNRVRELVYEPRGSESSNDDERSIYIIDSQSSRGRTSTYDSENEYGNYESYQSASKRNNKRKRQWSFADSTSTGRTTSNKRARKSGKRNQSSYQEDDGLTTIDLL